MPTVTVKLESPICRSFRVEQVAGMLDVPIERRLVHELTAEVPELDESWAVGAIVGPSGSGKTTLARAAFGAALVESSVEPRPWPEGRAIVDCLGEARGVGVLPAQEEATNLYGRRDACPTIKDITRGLVGVGLGSVPTWLKPYRVLSTGEKFRADLARAVMQRTEYGGQRSRETASVVVVDEFTGALDRLVAKTTSAALSRLLRSSAPRSEFPAPRWPRLVAVTCHPDVLPWLAPDWVLQLENGVAPRLTWHETKTPQIDLRIERVPQVMWQRFAPQHYLTGGLAASATCYAAWWEPERRMGAAVNQPIAFCAAVAALGWRKTKRITRLVTLPEFQGLGIGSRLAAAVAEREANQGNRVTITASHPAILAHCTNSPRWRFIDLKKSGSTRQQFGERAIRCSTGRAVASFEFVESRTQP